MGSNKGITLISLVSSVILILILASVTVVTSMSSYNQMKFEGAKSEIEQVEKLVDEIASDYQTFKSEKNSSVDYIAYFNERYGNKEDIFKDKVLTLSTNQEKAQTIISKYPELNIPSENMFYFTQDDLDKYFDLKGINDVVVDFSTRLVYSVEGIKDPDDKDHLYYTSSEWGNDTRVKNDETGKKVSSVTATASTSSSTVNGVSYKDITLTVNNFKPFEIYYKIGEGNKIKVDNFTTKDNTVKFAVPVPNNASYTFMVVDETNNSVQATITVNK